MAAPTNSYQRVAVSNTLEDYADVIYDVSPQEVPFITNSAQGTADNTTYDWTEDELDAANANNAHIDGDIFAAEAITPPTKLTNECEIARKDFRISRRARRVNKAGPDDEVARQVVRKGRELKRDIESSVLDNRAKVVDNGTVAPRTASLNAWIADMNTTGRTDRGATGADPTGDGTDAATDGTVRALSESGLRGVLKGVYLDSQEAPDAIMFHPDAKERFSNYIFGADAGIATQYQDQGRSPRGGVQAVGAVDVWVTDFAVVDIVPDRFQRPTDGLVVNFDFCEIKYFDPISTDAMAKDSDTDSRMVLADWGLCVRNRATLGVFADIDVSTAMVA